jgi:hypothetical protein
MEDDFEEDPPVVEEEGYYPREERVFPPGTVRVEIHEWMPAPGTRGRVHRVRKGGAIEDLCAQLPGRTPIAIRSRSNRRRHEIAAGELVREEQPPVEDEREAEPVAFLCAGVEEEGERLDQSAQEALEAAPWARYSVEEDALIVRFAQEEDGPRHKGGGRGRGARTWEDLGLSMQPQRTRRSLIDRWRKLASPDPEAGGWPHRGKGQMWSKADVQRPLANHHLDFEALCRLFPRPQSQSREAEAVCGEGEAEERSVKIVRAD